MPHRFGYQRKLVPSRRPIRTADGYITILPYSNAQWDRFFEAVGREDMLVHPWVTNMEERSRNIGGVYDRVEQPAIHRSTGEWVALMEQVDVPAMPVRRLHELPTDPHLAATAFFRNLNHSSEGSIWTTAPPVKCSATPARPDRMPAPRLREHSQEIVGSGQSGRRR